MICHHNNYELFSEHGTELMTQKENQLLRNISKLVVFQQNTMASVMGLMKLSQDTEHPVLNFIAQIKSAAQQGSASLK